VGMDLLAYILGFFILGWGVGFYFDQMEYPVSDRHFYKGGSIFFGILTGVIGVLIGLIFLLPLSII